MANRNRKKELFLIKISSPLFSHVNLICPRYNHYHHKMIEFHLSYYILRLNYKFSNVFLSAELIMYPGWIEDPLQQGVVTCLAGTVKETSTSLSFISHLEKDRLTDVHLPERQRIKMKNKKVCMDLLHIYDFRFVSKPFYIIF